MKTTVQIKNHAHAIRETKAYLGAARFALVVKELAKLQGRSAHKLRMLYFYLGLAGVEGRAVIHAMYRHIFPD